MTSIHHESKKVVWNDEKQLYNLVQLQNSPRQPDTVQPTHFRLQDKPDSNKAYIGPPRQFVIFSPPHIFTGILDC